MDANVHPSSLKEKPPQLLADAFYWILTFIEDNGWFLLGGAVIFLYVWSKVSSIIGKWLDDRAEREFRAKLHRDPDLVRIRQEAQEIARLKLQQQHDAQSQIAEEKRKEREERKREEWLARQGGNVAKAGYRLSDDYSSDQNNGTGKPKRAGWRPEYNPLAGSGGSGGFRPTRRSCPGGGCG